MIRAGGWRFEWHRFEPDSLLHPLLREAPNPAFTASSLDRAIAGATAILGLVPIPGYRVVAIADGAIAQFFAMTGIDGSGQRGSLSGTHFRGRSMFRILGLTFAATAALSSASFAATADRIRGTITAVSPGSVSLHTADGKDLAVALRDNTHYATVVKASLTDLVPGGYIGTATKEVGGTLIALEVVVFPPAMKGVGEGHYGWDRIPDTTLSGGASANSSMTNGTVSTVTAAGSANTTMTNGTVSATDTRGQAKQLTVTYKGGEQHILVPPTAPIVTPQPGTIADLAKGKVVFINAKEEDGKYAANYIAIGTEGVPPPM